MRPDNPDAWKADYDRWKLASPDDYYDDEPEDECEHEEYESDILTGRASCDRCGHTWFLSDDEIANEIERIRAYDEWQAEQERPWNRFKRWLNSTSLAAWVRRRRFDREMASNFDDEVPF